MVVYVSTWGDPSGWSEVTYKLPSKEIKSFSTIATYENPSKIILIVQDSVLTPQPKPKNKVVDNYLNKEKPSFYSLCLRNESTVNFYWLELLRKALRVLIRSTELKRKKIIINFISSF